MVLGEVSDKNAWPRDLPREKDTDSHLPAPRTPEPVHSPEGQWQLIGKGRMILGRLHLRRSKSELHMLQIFPKTLDLVDLAAQNDLYCVPYVFPSKYFYTLYGTELLLSSPLGHDYFLF